jgi:arylsulfatase A-like enzyme
MVPTRWILAALLGACPACGGAEPQAPAGVRAWPVAVQRGEESRHQYDRVVLVTLDTLRADHVSCYGYPRTTTPFLDSLAARGARFTRAMATASQTAPSHATMLTGLVPAVHGVQENGGELAPGAVDLARLFAERGFETAAFLNVKFLAGIAASFGKVGVRAVGPEKKLLTGADVVDAALAWLETERTSERFFLWVHLYDPHKWKDLVLESIQKSRRIWSGATPDDFLARVAELHGLPAPRAGEPYSVRWQVARSEARLDFTSPEGFLLCIDAYDELALFSDRQIERLHRGIEARAFSGRTLWIVTSDHGEGLASHGVAGHGGRIYQEQIRVPLVLGTSDGSIPARVVDELVSHVDLLPTLAETLGVRVAVRPELYDGRSLWPLLGGEGASWGPRAVFAQRRPTLDGNDPEAPDRAESYALQTAEAKLILHQSGKQEFFDLGSDPRELSNLGAGHAAGEALRVELERRLAPYRALAGAHAAADVPEEWQEELKKLGYAH